MSKPPATFDEFLRDTLPWIDEHLAARGTAVQDRPLTAARQIVDLFVIEVRGDTKENYLQKTWFAGIFKSINKWYERRYGDALRKSRQAKAFGIVTYFGTPYLLRVPLVFTEPGENGTAWINFPCEVLPSEEPLDWIETPPPLDTMKPKRKLALRVAAIRVATALRAINLDMNTANLTKERHRGLARSVIRHFEKAASDTATNEAENLSLAIWELQMACEKSIKVYLSQKQIEYPATHDLRALHRLALDGTDWSEVKTAMPGMPSEKRVMAWRYAEIPPPTPKEVERVYSSALVLCGAYAKRLSRKLIMRNAAIQIRRPPWFGEAQPCDQPDLAHKAAQGR